MYNVDDSLYLIEYIVGLLRKLLINFNFLFSFD